MTKVYDRFKFDFIDEADMEVIAPPERYVRMEEHNCHLKDVIVFCNGVDVGHGFVDEEHGILFSGCISVKKAKEAGFSWSSGEEGDDK